MSKVNDAAYILNEEEIKEHKELLTSKNEAYRLFYEFEKKIMHKMCPVKSRLGFRHLEIINNDEAIMYHYV